MYPPNAHWVQPEDWRDFPFCDGDILFIRNRRSGLGKLIRNALGDFDYEHVCQWFKGAIYTTGAGGFPWYGFGVVSPEVYFTQKVVAVGRYQDLTHEQQYQMYLTAQSLVGKSYPWWKLIALVIQGKLSSRVIKKVGFRVNPSPRFVFCAAAVALGLLSAQLPVTSKYQKYEPDAYTPRTLYDSPFIEIVAYFNHH